MTDTELTALVKEISRRYFEEPGLVKTTFDHQASWNNRLSSSGGRFLTGTCQLEFNPKQYRQFGLKELEGIIKHELVHYHLFRQGLPFKHGKEFKALLKAVGGARYCQALGVKRRWKTLFIYRCRKCGRHYARKRRVDTRKFCCGVKGCGGRLVRVPLNNFADQA